MAVFYDDNLNLELNKDDFTLVQSNANIHDQKFDTKVTTFAKDALKRFAKNKASVVGAIIIGLIILASIIVPLLVPYKIDGALNGEALLRPKLFEAGTGFWDGTERITIEAQSAENPIDNNLFPENTVSNITVFEENGKLMVSFTYDKYEHYYGNTYKQIYMVNLKSYRDNGWCTFDESDIKGTFKVLDERCPIVSIDSVDGSNIYGVVTQYKEMGYEKMPIHLFGTDDVGHDLFKKSFAGMQKSLIFAIVIAAICFAFGLIWGAISGYFGGNVDIFLERFKDVLAGVPLVVVVTLFRLNFGDNLFIFALALCITGWIGVASRTRTQFYRFKGREYVLASRTLGARDGRLIFKHILPNSLGTIVTSSVLMIPSLIFTEASLSYLGLGLGGSDSFGTVLANNQKYLQTYPALILFPAVVISLLMISFNLFGNGLRDALNPSLKGSE